MKFQNPMEGSAAAEPKKDFWTITRLNTVIRNMLQKEPTLQSIWVEGEIFNLNYHSSGHIYFSLKDENSQIKVTFFRNANAKFSHIKLENGIKILAKGSVSVYQPAGSYQLNLSAVMLAGEGELRLRIEQLKKKLFAEGLFAREHKRKLPFFPKTIGVATAATGAAIKDIIRVARNRYEDVNILLAPCRVQGDMAAASIITAIEALNLEEMQVDVIIAGRGGGSFEDLLAFNDEAVVRAFYNSRVPIVSAVGHEIDNPLSDLAADDYASTPSAAAELVVPEKKQLLYRISDSEIRMKVALRNQYKKANQKLLNLVVSRIYTQPQSIIENQIQLLDSSSRQLQYAMRHQISGFRELSRTGEKIPLLFRALFNQSKSRYALLGERLQNFSPLQTLKRGYAVVRTQSGEVVRNAKELKTAQLLEILLAEGSVVAEVKEINEK